MQPSLSKDEILNSLRGFKSRRDDLLHEDASVFDHHLSRFVELCRNDNLVQQILEPIEKKHAVDVNAWWEEVGGTRGKLSFPQDSDEELLLRFKISESLVNEPRVILNLPVAGLKRRDHIEFFRVAVLRPLADELSYRLGQVADLASPDARALQAVPLSRVPGSRETKIFLSHKSVDKPKVSRYYRALKAAGFDPWLDEPNMAAGANLEREIFRGFEESCAAVFFITDNFKDEKYLAAEVDYAIRQKRNKGKRFSIITLRYSNAAPVPDLLTPYIYKNVENDIEGLAEILRALPIEVGPVRWKAEVVD